MISEVNWTPPNRFRAEFPVLAAAYGALQGGDAIFHFAAGSPAWEGLPGKFGIQTPTQLGQFPATALIFRQGLVKTAPPVVSLRLAVDDLFALKGTPMPATQNFDQLRGHDVPVGATLTHVSAVDSLAFLVGRVTVDFLTNGVPSPQVTDLSPHLDRAAKTAKSHTRELEWNWATGLVTLNAPAVQGVTGFLAAAGKTELPDVTVKSPMEYGSILLVALDGRSVAASGRLLLQVMSEERPYQWATDAATGPRVITNSGQPPLLVRNLRGTVSLKRADAARLKVTALDENGYRASESSGTGEAITLQPDRFYYLIHAD